MVLFKWIRDLKKWRRFHCFPNVSNLKWELHADATEKKNSSWILQRCSITIKKEPPNFRHPTHLSKETLTTKEAVKAGQTIKPATSKRLSIKNNQKSEWWVPRGVFWISYQWLLRHGPPSRSYAPHRLYPQMNAIVVFSGWTTIQLV